jgi:DNA-binding MarR family transcriptional regulator
MPTPLSVLKQFRTVFNTVKQHFLTVETEYRISGAQLWALSVVIRTPGLRVSDLAAAMAIHQSTASNLVERLSERGLLQRRRSTLDHRVVHLEPAPKGIKLMEQIDQPPEGVLPQALAQLSPQSLGELHRLLNELIVILEAKDASGVPLDDTL